MLEGNELEKTYDGGAGKIVIDVDDKGNVLISNTYKKDVDGYAEVESVTSVKTNILNILEKVAAKTKTTWDDKAIAGIKALLGLAKNEEPKA